MFSSRFFKKFLALNLVAFSAAALFSHLPFSSTNTLVDNEASLTSTGSAFGSGLDRPFNLYNRSTMYVNNNDGYIYYAGDNVYGAAGNGSNGGLTSFNYALRKRNSATTSVEGTDKIEETGYFTEMKDYSNGAQTTFIIDKDGAVWSAGRNLYGELGNRGITNATYNGVKSYSTFQVASMTVDGVTSYFTSGAVKVEATLNATLIEMEDGSLWATGLKSYIGLGHLDANPNTFVETIDAYTVEARRGIVDFTCGTSSYVLFGDGSLWTTSKATDAEWTQIASNIKMFDNDIGYIYTVDQSNNISYMYYTDTEFTYLTTPTEEVMQVRGGGIQNENSSGAHFAWGYLTTDGNLYLSAITAQPGKKHNTEVTLVNAVSTTNPEGKVSYFDLGSSWINYAGSNDGVTYSYLEADEDTGSMRLWGYNEFGQLGTGGTGSVSFASRRTIAINKTVDLNPGLVNTPPARKNTPPQNTI